MFRRLVATDRDWGATILRTVPGVVFFAHGAQKLLGGFGGDGLAGLTVPLPHGFFMHWTGA